MKRFTLLSILTLAIPLILTGQNQNEIIDDVYFTPSIQATIMKTNSNKAPEKHINNSPRPNYKNGTKEIVFKERQVKYPTIIRDTVFADGKSPDGYAIHSGNFDIKSYDGRTNPVYLHDTIYSEGTANIENDNYENQESGHYLNGFNGSESDKEYAERIRRFHNPKYTIFIGDPRYNDIYFLNSSDWNVYVDDSYAYVTPTWTNPYWWNYSINPYGYGYGFGSWGHGWNSPYYGFGGMYNNWYGYDSFYGYGGMYGYGNYWDPYVYSGYYGYGGYGGFYGNGGYYGGLSGNIRKNYNEGTRRTSSNYSTDNSGRLGGTRSAAGSSSATVNSGGLISSRNQYTMVSGSGANNGSITRTTSNSGTRFVSNPSNGIGVVRNTTNRGISNSNPGNSYSNYNSTTRSSTTSGMNINTSPRTYTATSNSVPTSGNYTSRDNNSSSTVSSFRNTNPTITRSSGTTTSPSRGNYSSGNSQSSVTRSTPTYSTPSSSSYSSGSSSSYSNGNSSSSSGNSSSGGGSRSSSSSNSGGRR